MKWAYRAGLAVLLVVAYFAGHTTGHSSSDEELDIAEAECEEAGGVLARTRSGYACVVPAHHAI